VSQLTAALIGAVTAQVVTIVAGLAVGNRMSLRLDARKRQTELDLQALSSFYELYGEFFVHLKRWSTLRRAKRGGVSQEDERTSLLNDAYAAEGRMEALLVKIAAEQPLRPHDRELLGSFRQAYQQIREAIRDDKELPWDRSDQPEYVAYKSLAAATTCLIARRWDPKADDATGKTIDAVLDITDNKYASSWAQQPFRGSTRSL
jgi:hypothetical protein